MKNTFLEYYKLVLQKVSFDQQLFKKELAKAIRSIEKHEIDDLFKWLNDQGLKSDLISVKANSRSFIPK